MSNIEEDVNELKSIMNLRTESGFAYSQKNTLKLQKSIRNVLAEIEKKDKQIDLMAKFIENNMSEKKIINEICIKSKCNNEECHEDDLKDCIKQYFERKVEDVIKD